MAAIAATGARLLHSSSHLCVMALFTMFSRLRPSTISRFEPETLGCCRMNSSVLPSTAARTATARSSRRTSRAAPDALQLRQILHLALSPVGLPPAFEIRRRASPFGCSSSVFIRCSVSTNCCPAAFASSGAPVIACQAFSVNSFWLWGEAGHGTFPASSLGCLGAGDAVTC